MLITSNQYNLQFEFWYLVAQKVCGNGWYSWICGALDIKWILFCREIAILIDEQLHFLQPKSECLCPERFPRAVKSENGFSFYCARNHESDDDKVPRHVHRDGGRLFLPEYLTDGVYEATFYKDVNRGKRLRSNSGFIYSPLFPCPFFITNRRFI